MQITNIYSLHSIFFHPSTRYSLFSHAHALPDLISNGSIDITKYNYYFFLPRMVETLDYFRPPNFHENI